MPKTISFTKIQDYPGNNNRFRFRLYDTEEKKYTSLCFFCRLHNSFLEPEGDYLILEQCTGQTDKNGKLIFEGDIIMFAGVKMTVEWSVGSCRWVLRYADKKHSHYGEAMSMSSPNNEFFGNEYIIIGNIHDKDKDK